MMEGKAKVQGTPSNRNIMWLKDVEPHKVMYQNCHTVERKEDRKIFNYWYKRGMGVLKGIGRQEEYCSTILRM
jgi:hypothetical protein